MTTFTGWYPKMPYQITVSWKQGVYKGWQAFQDISNTLHAETQEFMESLVDSKQRAGASKIVVQDGKGKVILDWKNLAPPSIISF